MIYAIAMILLLAWLVSLAFHVTVGAIHLLLVVAAVMFVVGFARRRIGGGTGTNRHVLP